ncbi:MAG: hypothetical protein IKM94_04715 [Alphaproteobacteria bacterium]|nr:hypothetical protein [Alphaproteobacteria bacterium]
MVKYKSVVLKFGGSVIPDENGIYKVANVIKNLSSQYNVMAVVVSAMGKTTNNLDALAHRVAKKPNVRELDALLATGEMQSAALLAMRLNAIGVPARSYNAWQCGIQTDDNFGNAKINHLDLHNINTFYGLPIVTGFQGVTQHGDITTLGREGSDISAVAIAAALGADFCWFFKNGGGICEKYLNKDKILQQISYTKMQQLMRDGRPGHVLHKRSIDMAQKYNVPLYVSGINDFDNGTWILSHVHAKLH